MNKKVTLTNHVGGYNSTITAYKSNTDNRIVMDLGSLGFHASEIDFTAKSNGDVTVTGKVKKGNPTYDMDGDLDRFGHNAVRKDFKVTMNFNSAKYDMSRTKVSTENGVTRIQTPKHGKYAKPVNPCISGSFKRPIVKAPVVRRCFEDLYPCTGYAYQCSDPCRSYYVPAPRTVANGYSSSYAVQ